MTTLHQASARLFNIPFKVNNSGKQAVRGPSVFNLPTTTTTSPAVSNVNSNSNMLNSVISSISDLTILERLLARISMATALGHDILVGVRK